MTSDRRREANIANARVSTGPRSEAGKAQSSKNALRHGLNVSIWDDPALTRRAEELALRIAGPGADPDRLVRARAIAEAQFALDRVRSRRMGILQEEPPSSQSVIEKELRLIGAIGRLDPNKRAHFEALRPQPLDGDERLIQILDKRARELARLDRYESRAISRRKFAIRMFDVS
jgi:hypothetical protein